MGVCTTAFGTSTLTTTTSGDKVIIHWKKKPFLSFVPNFFTPCKVGVKRLARECYECWKFTNTWKEIGLVHRSKNNSILPNRETVIFSGNSWITDHWWLGQCSREAGVKARPVLPIICFRTMLSTGTNSGLNHCSHSCVLHLENKTKVTHSNNYTKLLHLKTEVNSSQSVGSSVYDFSIIF